VNSKGSLTVVGLGIQFASHVTSGARDHIERADKVLALTGNPIATSWVTELNPATESLDTCYRRGKQRLVIYTAMVDRIMACVRAGLDVCVVSYGHPGYLVHATRESMRQAKAEGYRTEMQPGISSVDCLFADLGLDPGEAGCQTFEATHFLLHKRRIDPTCPLILLQVGVAGELACKKRYGREGLRTLIAVLCKQYGPKHEAIVYEAAQYPFVDPRIRRMPLDAVPRARLSEYSTLYLPPKRRARLDRAMLKRLRLTREEPKAK